ncbi:uncharacterized protein PGTG_02084 [Puccinia graminis f. sp. tritici CRL 75-36-700-3]|uniref:NuA3 HAT complex component nto1 n=1 Tax=Puccinia graminis f. sp. tritici (strain CRL 75-36-700-3 / race SCCL) TaxID=418459 RepID=E3JX48_PUCGT|nr:uncharacterized protein PGTG_02084 [Puccinia graminis f. sp. tritici CRL 75-36-700-3]EFP76623.2 hypothetical protein PGTG_02084 [Puccinia graminis f. sp. tritici CRL 75-36-700-3]
MATTGLYTLNDPVQQDHPNYGPPLDQANPITPSVPIHQLQDHQSSYDPYRDPTASLATHYIECSRDSSGSNTNNGQDSHLASNDSSPFGSNGNQLTPNMDANTNFQAIMTAIDDPSTQPNQPLASIEPDPSISNAKPANHANSHDPALDEDAPHEEDDDEGSDNDSSFINPPVLTGDTYQDGSIDPNHPLTTSNLHSWSHPQTSHHQEIEQKPEIPSSSEPLSTRKRKRTSDQNGSVKTPARRESGRPKQTPRVKSAEQVAREALIEQQNPHASKNELRSLKLRALHAIRIAERELNMPEAEKQRRLRLREYVRHKRAEERSLKGSGKTGTTGAEAELKPRSAKSGSRSSSQSAKIKQEVEPSDHQEEPQATNSHLPMAVSYPNQSQQLPSPSAPSPMNDLPDNQLAPNGHTSNSKRKAAPKKSEKPPKGKSAPRAKRSVASLEAEIKRRNPNASPTQLKSLKLRALHADRIAEREQNMSEKDKIRRQKLREYMRRRREEERVEKGQAPTELSSYIEAKVASDSTLRYRRSLDSSTSMNEESQVNPDDSSMSGLTAAPLVPEGMNADDRLAAFSMMELTNNYQHQFAQPHHVPVPSPNLHLHPLFQMPMGQPSIEVPSPYDSIHTGYPAMTEQWAHVPQPDPSSLPADEMAEKALHAALEEAIYMKPHDHNQIPLGEQQQQLHHHHPHYSPTEQSIEADRLARLEQERIQLAEDEILGIERARELAMIAAAAAEVEHAQQISGSTSSHRLR